MSLKKIATITLCTSTLVLLPMKALALKITNLESLTQKQIEQSYFFDWNRNSIFRGSLFKTFKNSGIAMPMWLRRGGGGSAPAKVIHSGSTHFVLLDTCKPHDCYNNVIYVLFDPVSKTMAAVGKFDTKITWVGKPNENIKQILRNASGLR